MSGCSLSGRLKPCNADSNTTPRRGLPTMSVQRDGRPMLERISRIRIRMKGSEVLLYKMKSLPFDRLQEFYSTLLWIVAPLHLQVGSSRERQLCTGRAV